MRECCADDLCAFGGDRARVVSEYLCADPRIVEFIYHMGSIYACVIDHARKIKWCIYFSNSKGRGEGTNTRDVCECMYSTRMKMYVSLDTIGHDAARYYWRGVSNIEEQARIDIWRAMFECKDGCKCKIHMDLADLVCEISTDAMRAQGINIEIYEVKIIAMRLMDALRAQITAEIAAGMDEEDEEVCLDVCKCEVCAPMAI